MLPNVYTVIFLCELEYQERLRNVAKERLAASAQQSKPSLFARVSAATHAATAWIRGQMPQPRGEQRARTAPSLARDYGIAMKPIDLDQAASETI